MPEATFAVHAVTWASQDQRGLGIAVSAGSEPHQHGRHALSGRLRYDRRVESHLAAISRELPGDLGVGLEVDDRPAAGLLEREIQHASSREPSGWRHATGVSRRPGRAIDVRFPALPLAEVRRTALDLGGGGVGYYPASDFVHLVSGRARSWYRARLTA